MNSTQTTETLVAGLSGTLLRQETRTTPQTSQAMAPRWRQDDRWRAFHLGLDSGQHPKVEKLARTAEWFAKAYLEDDRANGDSLCLAGNTGCGKTHAARRIHAYVHARQISAWASGKFGPVNHLGAPAFLRWEKVAEVTDSEWDEIIAGEVRPSRLVILDDIGADTDRFKSGVPARRLKEVLDAAEGKWLLVTTNIQRTNWKAHFGQRVADRLSRCRYLGLFEVPSYRTTKAGGTE